MFKVRGDTEEISCGVVEIFIYFPEGPRITTKNNFFLVPNLTSFCVGFLGV